jgi:ssDNA-binding Zn-finger/Zn-ribbon topoisomerase 1
MSNTAYLIRMRCSRTGRLFAVHFVHSESNGMKIALIQSEASMNAWVRTAVRERVLDPSSRHSGDFDWTNLTCPHCGFSAKTGAQFVKCGRCRELVCGGTLSSAELLPQTFSCHSGCGNSGIVSGMIESYAGLSADGSVAEREGLG